MRIFPFLKKKQKVEIDLDEIFLDASNLPEFNRGRLEGRIEIPLARRGMIAVGIVFTLIASVFLVQLFRLQIISGAEYAKRSFNNHLDHSLLFSERGVIFDRTGEKMAWNIDSSEQKDFALRMYTDRRGMGQVLGYVNYPRKDSSGFYFRTAYAGRGGVEESYDSALAGENGERLLEVDVHGKVISEHVVHMPKTGGSVTLTLDAELSEALYDHIATSAAKVGFRSGAGAIMDAHTGEIIALASYPSYDPEALTRGDAALLKEYAADTRLPYLNKVTSGIYTPGSIVKPIMALAALTEKIISPEKQLLSTGALIIPNPYTPSQPSIFKDWKAHGWMDMRHAIEESSDEYFYIVGGGYKDQKGLGIAKIYQYMHLFGLDSITGIQLPGEADGVIPTPEWKKKVFKEDWRLGDTYHTSIGQFGFQVTPLAMLRAYGAIANGGTLVNPIVVKGEKQETSKVSNISDESLRVVHEGMRLSAETGTARSLNRPDMTFGAKTGTAELGTHKEYVNSWVIGYYPYEKPKYVFVLLMEHGPHANLFGAPPIMSQFFNWIKEHKPEYFPTTNPV